MPANTTRAQLPYPLGTDPVADGDDAIRNLANRLDGSAGALASVPFAMAAGASNISMGGATQAQVAVTFPVGRFTAGGAGIPMIVQMSIQSTGVANGYMARMTGPPNNSGFTAILNTAAASSNVVPIGWIAVQMTSTTGNG